MTEASAYLYEAWSVCFFGTEWHATQYMVNEAGAVPTGSVFHAIYYHNIVQWMEARKMTLAGSMDSPNTGQMQLWCDPLLNADPTEVEA